MRRKNVILPVAPAWERRKYWRKGFVADVEVWRAGRLLPVLPRRVPPIAVSSDYCEAHRTRIFVDLPCQFCGERPVPMIVERAGVMQVES